jgi:hypothetical protein
VAASFVAAGDGDRGAVLGEQFRNFSADAGRGAGDEDVLAVEFHRLFLLG